MVYFFSKFTSEALFFELLGIFLLTSFYAAYLLTRKKKWFVEEDEVSAGVVKEYLGTLIGEAKDIEVELFGTSSEVTSTPHRTARMATAAAGDTATVSTENLSPEAQIQATELQARIQLLMSENAQLKSQIEELKKVAQGGAAVQGSKEATDLKQKLQAAEERLAEYSIIEDDLANLKRLQQENAKLKAQLGAGAAPAGAVSVPEPVSPKAEAAISQPVKAPEENVNLTAPEATAALSPEGAPAIDAPTGDVASQFDQLVGDVERSLSDVAKPEPAVNDLEAAMSNAEAAAPAQASKPAADADLLAEFEKMLGA